MDIDRTVEIFVMLEVQKKHYSLEISVLKSGSQLPRDSDIRSLSPYLDESDFCQSGYYPQEISSQFTCARFS